MKPEYKNLVHKATLIIAASLGMLCNTACNSDDVDEDSYYTFTGETVASYCENRPESFSIFSNIIKDSGLEPLLSTYGHYTCFIPND